MHDYLRRRLQLEYASPWRIALCGALAGMALPLLGIAVSLAALRWLPVSAAHVVIAGALGALYLALVGLLAALANQHVSRQNDYGLAASAAILIFFSLPLTIPFLLNLFHIRPTRLLDFFSPASLTAILQDGLFLGLLGGLLLAVAWETLFHLLLPRLSDADWQTIMDRIVNETYHRDWIAYNHKIATQLRIARYLRSGQVEKAAALEAQVSSSTSHRHGAPHENGLKAVRDGEHADRD